MLSRLGSAGGGGGEGHPYHSNRKLPGAPGPEVAVLHGNSPAEACRQTLGPADRAQAGHNQYAYESALSGQKAIQAGRASAAGRLAGYQGPSRAGCL